MDEAVCLQPFLEIHREYSRLLQGSHASLRFAHSPGGGWCGHFSVIILIAVWKLLLLLLLLFVVVIIVAVAVAVAVAILIYIHILISRSNAPVGEWGETKVASNLSFGPKLLPILVKIIRIAPLSFTGTIAAYPQGNGDCPIRNQRSSSTALLNIMGNFDHLRRANQIELGGLA